MMIKKFLAAIVFTLLALSATACVRQAYSFKALAVRISSPDADAAEPAIATSSNGAVYVAWVEHVDGGANIMVGQFDSTGAATSPAVRVNPKMGEATAWRGDPPSVAVASDGTLYVAWTLRVPEQRHGTDLYVSVSRDSGRSFEAPVRINADHQSGPQGMHSLAIGLEGTVYAAWLEERKKPHPVVVDKSPQNINTWKKTATCLWPSPKTAAQRFHQRHKSPGTPVLVVRLHWLSRPMDAAMQVGDKCCREIYAISPWRL